MASRLDLHRKKNAKKPSTDILKDKKQMIILYCSMPTVRMIYGKCCRLENMK